MLLDYLLPILQDSIITDKVNVDHDSYSWSCLKCGLPNFSTTFFETSESSFELSNSFSALDTSQSPLTSTPAKKLSRAFAKKQTPRKLKVLNINFQSVVNKVQEFHCLLDTENPDIVVGTESWLSPDIASSEIFPEGYHSFRADRKSKSKRSGGVFILVRNSLICTEQPQFQTNCEILWVKIEISGSRPLFVGAYYRRVEDDLESLREFQDSVSRVREHSDNVWVLGDFNLPMLSWPESSPEMKPDCSHKQVYDFFLSTIADYNFTQVVTEPARGDNILDLFLTTNPALINKVNCSPGLGDHDVVSAEALLRPALHKQRPRGVFIFGGAGWPALGAKMKLYQQSFLSNHCGRTVEQLWTDFTTTLGRLVQECMPAGLVRGGSSLPWVAREIKRLIRKRDSLYRKFKRSGDSDIKTKFQTLRQQVEKKIKDSCRACLGGLLGLGGGDGGCGSRGLFSFLKNSRCDQQGIPPLKRGSILYSDTGAGAGLFDQRFGSVFAPGGPLSLSRLASVRVRGLKKAGGLPSDTTPDSLQDSATDMPEIGISEGGLVGLLRGLRPGGAAGPDRLKPLLLRELREEVAPIVQVVFDGSLGAGRLPANWVGAGVVPVFRGGDRSLAAGCRPVSLACILCKVLEHILASSVVRHLDGRGILYDLQHGFREKRSCETQLIMLIEDLAGNASVGKRTDIILLDFSGAFGGVGRSGLLWRLRQYGIRGHVLNWVRAFLGSRSQRVVIEGEGSESIPVTSGVPQGSVLGPILFLIYINDLPDEVCSQVRLFADDTALYLTMESEDSGPTLQSDLDILSMWETRWDMEFNPSKCQVVHVAGSKRPEKRDYILHSQVLESVTCAKYLGVDISGSLTWNSHIDRITGSANRTLGFVRRNIKTRMSKVRETAYNTLVRPQLEYASAVWDPHNKNRISQIEQVQRRAARWTVSNFDRKASVTEIVQDLGWRTLDQRRADARLCLLFKILHGLVAVPLPDYIQHSTRISRYCHSMTFRQVSTSTDYYKYSFFPLAIVQWNALPQSVACLQNLEVFKTTVCKLQHSRP